MKNKIGYVLSVIAMFGLVLALIVSCAQQKKDRLTSDTLDISITPQVITVSTGMAQTLTAVCKSANTNNADVLPQWTVESSYLGTFNPTKGKTTIFTATNSALAIGSGKIYATYSNIKASANVYVSSSSPSLGTITISPASVSITTGAAQSFTVVCKDVSGNVVSASPAWSVSPTMLGPFSPTSGSAVTFTANPSIMAVGNGTINASCAGFNPGSASISVTSNTVGGGGSPSTTIFGIYSETYVSPGYNMLKFDTANPPDAYGGVMGQYDAAAITKSTTIKNEGTESMQCVLTLTGPSWHAWGGWWIQFGSDGTPGFNADARVAKNMSSFSGGSLHFDIKTPSNLTITIESGPVGSAVTKSVSLSSIPVATDDAWHSVTIPMSSFSGTDFTQIQVPVGFNSASINFTFYVDNIYWTTY